MAERRDNSGTLNKNEDKTEQNPTWADYKGKCIIDGRDYWISAWIKEYQGRKFMSLSFKEKDAGGQAGGPYPRNRESIGAQARPEQPFGDEQQFKEDDIPF